MIHWPFVLRSTMERFVRLWSDVAAARFETCGILRCELVETQWRLAEAERERDAAQAELAKFARKRGPGGRFVA